MKNAIKKVEAVAKYNIKLNQLKVNSNGHKDVIEVLDFEENKYRFGHIYLTISPDGRCYIGQHCPTIWNPEYIGSGSHILFLLDIGVKREKFKRYIIETVDNIDEANEREIYWIARYKANVDQDYWMNIQAGGSHQYNNIPIVAYIDGKFHGEYNSQLECALDIYRLSDNKSSPEAAQARIVGSLQGTFSAASDFYNFCFFKSGTDKELIEAHLNLWEKEMFESEYHKPVIIFERDNSDKESIWKRTDYPNRFIASRNFKYAEQRKNPMRALVRLLAGKNYSSGPGQNIRAFYKEEESKMSDKEYFERFNEPKKTDNSGPYVLLKKEDNFYRKLKEFKTQIEIAEYLASKINLSTGRVVSYVNSTFLKRTEEVKSQSKIYGYSVLTKRDYEQLNKNNLIHPHDVNDFC